MNISLNPRRLLIIGALGLVSAATLGFAASNTVSGSYAGDGSGTVSGYNITNLHYNLDSTNPNLTTSITFNINPALTGTSTKRVSFDNGANWIPAVNCSGNNPVTCTAAVSVQTLTSVRIVAAD